MLQVRTVGWFLKLEDVEVQICDMFNMHNLRLARFQFAPELDYFGKVKVGERKRKVGRWRNNSFYWN